MDIEKAFDSLDHTFLISVLKMFGFGNNFVNWIETLISKQEGFSVTMDIEKVFDSLDHTFLISVLKMFGFGNNFVNWIETLISKQESCVINDGNTTQYFILKEGLTKVTPFRSISLSLL